MVSRAINIEGVDSIPAALASRMGDHIQLTPAEEAAADARIAAAKAELFRRHVAKLKREPQTTTPTRKRRDEFDDEE